MERPLTYYKQRKFKEIDANSTLLISQGFTYESKVFSLSTHMQLNLSTYIQMEEMAFIDYPVILSTIDNLDSVSIANQGALRQFDKDAYTVVSGILISGNDLKQEVRDAVDIAAVNAIVDTR